LVRSRDKPVEGNGHVAGGVAHAPSTAAAQQSSP
jgi:hypothetical protein